MSKGLRIGLKPSDGWLAAGFVAAAAVEAVARYHDQPGLLAVNLPGSLVFACLVLRRARPLVTMTAMTVLSAAGSAAQATVAPHTSGDAIVPIFAVLVVSYSLGAYAPRRQLLLGAPQPVLIVLAVDLTQPSGHSLLSAVGFFGVFVGGVPVLAGRLVRGRSALVRQLREQADQIAGEQRAQVSAALARERLRMTDHFHETLMAGVQSLTALAEAADTTTDGREQAIGRIETEARQLLAQTRQEVVSLTSRPAEPEVGRTEPPRHTPTLPAMSGLGDAAQPWTVLAGGALCAGLLVETRTLAVHAPLPVVWLGCIAIAAPLALAWARPLPMVATVWALAALFDAFVAPLDKSFSAVGLSFVPPFVVAGLEVRQRALAGLGVCLLGELACFGPSGLASDGAIVVCCWLGGAVFHERARLVEQLRANNLLLDAQRVVASAQAVVDERLRVARDLHDAVGHSLTVIALQAGAARRMCHTDPLRTDAVMRTIMSVARDALAELQGGVAPDGADGPPKPTTRSIEDLLTAAGAAGLSIDAHLDAIEVLLAPGPRLAAYRIVQEAVTNILKHAPGANAQVTVRAVGTDAEIVVTNSASNARTADPAPDGNGLAGMRQRAAACGGRITWGPRPDGGFEVRAQLPTQLASL